MHIIYIPAKKTSLSVGDSYGGGIVGYIYQLGDPGYVEGQCHGIIASTSDLSIAIAWYNGSYKTTGATTLDLGAGATNTTTIVASQGVGSYAAYLCLDYVSGAYSDWCLPSFNELYKIYLNRIAIGGLYATDYWCSVESNANEAFAVDFNYLGVASVWNKSRTNRVRAIRYF